MIDRLAGDCDHGSAPSGFRNPFLAAFQEHRQIDMTRTGRDRQHTLPRRDARPCLDDILIRRQRLRHRFAVRRERGRVKDHDVPPLPILSRLSQKFESISNDSFAC